MPKILKKSEKIVRAAMELFYKNGFHATGIEAILKKAQVSKKTLYAYFESKDALILETLKYRSDQFSGFWERVRERANTPRDCLLVIFDLQKEWFESDMFYGCLFINAVGEYSRKGNPFKKMSQTVKVETYENIKRLLEEMSHPNPPSAAEKITLLFEGAIVTAQVSGESRSADIAKEIVKTILDNDMQEKKQAAAEVEEIAASEIV
jgi:AcrR family transcriptional regulator